MTLQTLTQRWADFWLGLRILLIENRAISQELDGQAKKATASWREAAELKAKRVVKHG